MFDRALLARAASIALVTLMTFGSSTFAAPAASANADVTDSAASSNDVAALPPSEEGHDADPATSGVEEQAVTEPVDPMPPSDVAPANDAATVEPVVEQEVPESGAVADPEVLAQNPLTLTTGELSWGVSSSLRALSASAGARPEPLGNTLNAAEGEAVVWQNGSGISAADGTTLDMQFDDADGVRFNLLPSPGESGGTVSLAIAAPRVVVLSPGVGELHVDITTQEVNSSGVAGQHSEVADVVLADLQLPDPEISPAALVWSGVTATLTASGAEFLGDSFEAGAELDPLTFATASALPSEYRTLDVSPKETTTTIEASKSSISEGDALTVIASVTPGEARGSVQFFDAEKKLGAVVHSDAGVFELTTKKLHAGSRTITAEFTPDDSAQFAPSTSASVTVKVAPAAPPVTEGKVAGATLNWGVKASFRNYIYKFTAFKGESKLLGTTTQPVTEGEFRWSGGSGTAMSDGSKADVSYGKGNGVHFRSHPMTGGYALDLTFTNPRVVVNSATAGELRMDVTGFKFKNMNEIGAPFSLRDVKMATLALPTPTASSDGKALTWTGASATLTKEGAVAFGGFYDANETLDPLTFSLPLDTAVSTKTPTSINLSAAATKLSDGEKVALSARVSPRLAGTVVFSAGGTALGKPVTVKKGEAAKLQVRLPSGIHSVIASFSPASSEYGHSLSNAVKITVTSGSAPPESGGTPTSTQAAGSLNWGVSSAFVAYTTCVNKEDFGFSHCAKGAVSTSGVGAGYLFPQSTDSSWNKAAQTGTVNYSGVVSFTGYGMTMFRVANPSITVTDSNTATLNTGNDTSFGSASYSLDLSSADKAVGPNGEVTWSNVPVRGTLSSGGAGGSGSQSIGLDNLSFTVGAASAVSYGSTEQGSDKEKRTAADSAPATTGITVLTDAAKIKPGGRIELEARGFDPKDEGVLVVLYGAAGTDPVVLDEEATASEAGLVSWSGTLPKEATGEHTITLQGSTDAGAVIDILDIEAAKKAAAKSPVALAEQQEAQAAGVAAAAATPANMSTWEWWASAGGLVAIAACMTLLVIRQRKLVG